MSTMKLDVEGTATSFHARLEHLIARELQLNVLHEEIINKREALLGASRNMLHKTAGQDAVLSNTDATIRNGKLLKDVQSLEETSKHLQEPVSPSFAYLQANYKSMVENMFPIWQKSLEEMQATEITRGTKNR
ncbi:unnamed protein product [Candidula unifasciata]|uniref:Uncharacterized protein n=1 Tax=Candidula unifasciata TaxID=100452 RepID=A0A8S3Z5M6_9EUPU|nr:unnamed protein product [Candidula unifasciata]